MRPEDVDGFRRDGADSDEPIVHRLIADADQLLRQAHQIEEPPYLAAEQVTTRLFGTFGIRLCGAPGALLKVRNDWGWRGWSLDTCPYARATCERMASIAEWDPMGSSSLGHNDEAHMSVIWHGYHACDCVWDQFTDAERRKGHRTVRRRGEITCEHMHDRGTYGITRFDSHAGREIVFLAFIGLTFHEPYVTKKWAAWLRPVLLPGCGRYGRRDDGGWAQGLSYAQAYVGIMTMFTSALKRGRALICTRGHFGKIMLDGVGRCLAAYARWMGFGDHSE